jgi:hypothetical protein
MVLLPPHKDERKQKPGGDDPRHLQSPPARTASVHADTRQRRGLRQLVARACDRLRSPLIDVSAVSFQIN